MTLSAGELRHRVELQQPTDATDARGEPRLVPRGAAVCWASVEPQSAGERSSGGRVEGAVTHLVKMRYRSDVGSRWRVILTKGGERRTLEVVGVVNVKESDRELQLSCREIV